MCRGWFKAPIIYLAAAMMVACWAANVMAGNAPKVVLMETMPVPVVLAHSTWFQAHFKEACAARGITPDLVVLKADGDRALATKRLAAELDKGAPDLVVTVATLASQAAAGLLQGTDVPLLFCVVSDPVGAGLIERVGAPTGTRITGRVFTIPRQAKLEMIHRLTGRTVSGRPVRLGFIHSTYPSSLGDLRKLKAACRERGDMVMVAYEIPYREVPRGLPAMIAETRKAAVKLQGQVDYWMEPSGPLGETTVYTAALLRASGVPIAFGTKPESVKLGALMHATLDAEDGAREIAGLALGILNGADPGRIPVVPARACKLGFNLDTAIRLEIVIPPDMLELADPKHMHRQAGRP